MLKPSIFDAIDLVQCFYDLRRSKGIAIVRRDSPQPRRDIGGARTPHYAKSVENERCLREAKISAFSMSSGYSGGTVVALRRDGYLSYACRPEYLKTYATIVPSSASAPGVNSMSRE